jgi:hypothetical protein
MKMSKKPGKTKNLIPIAKKIIIKYPILNSYTNNFSNNWPKRKLILLQQSLYNLNSTQSQINKFWNLLNKI